MVKCQCGSEILGGLGYVDKCHNCSREELMNMSDEALADELTRKVYLHYEDWELREAIRRILLKKEG